MMSSWRHQTNRKTHPTRDVTNQKPEAQKLKKIFILNHKTSRVFKAVFPNPGRQALGANKFSLNALKQ